MKKANTIISLLLVSSMFAAATSDVVLNKGLTSNGSKLALNCAEEVYGIQFDMHFNPSEINIVNLGSLVPGASLHISDPKSNDGGHVRVLMFSMDLDRLSKSNELSDIIDFESSLIASDASITLDNIIVAGKNGEQVDNAKTVQLTFDEQQPQTQSYRRFIQTHLIHQLLLSIL
jgi:hypothetical protein